ncbi:MAG TPA: EcsC family protein [Acetobacteraceae bacterium]|nr:EcsC family protein [Acetobacteraceae bacterium]
MSDIRLAHPAVMVPPRLDPASERELRRALHRMEHDRGLLVRLADLVGETLGGATRLGVRALGAAPGLRDRLRGVVEAALARAYDVAILGMVPAARPADETLPRPPRPGRSLRAARSGTLTRMLVIASGVAGGFAGFAGFVPDASFTTLAIMRRIAAIAREEGEDLADEEARRACLQVFALHSAAEEPEAEFSYFSARLLLQGGPLVGLITQVASRYGMALSEKLAAQSVPLAGAAAGAAINAAFLAHYTSLARAHFTIRRLERIFGHEAVQAAVERIRAE